MAEKGTGLPEISVLMPAYNAERYIEAAIRSLEEQTVENWELIVVDDCSTDGTAQLLRRLAAEDPRIRPIFSAENRGAAASRNLALEQCRGSYVALLDADDLWRPRKLERQLALAEKTGADIVYCSYALIDEAGEKNGAPFVVRETTDFEKMLVCNTLSCSTVFIKREAMRPFDTRFYHEDYALWLELLRGGGHGRGAGGLPHPAGLPVQQQVEKCAAPLGDLSGSAGAVSGEAVGPDAAVHPERVEKICGYEAIAYGYRCNGTQAQASAGAAGNAEGI